MLASGGWTAMETLTLLLVDDNSFFRRLAERFLANSSEWQLVGSAADAEEALAKAAELRPEVVLLDLNMPSTSGLGLIPRLRRLLPGVKIIVLTLWESDLYRQAALAAGANDFVPKSLINSHLPPAIRRMGAMAPSVAT